MSISTKPIFLCGATASGKSSLAVYLAQKLNGEIVNADAFQLYRGLEILVAAPTKEEQCLVPHHLYGVLESTEKCDAMQYRKLALPVIKTIQESGKTPIIVGGSGLYLKFLTHGPSPLPAGDPELRKRLDAKELDELVDELRARDPEAAAQTALENRRYVTRALEICILSGKLCSKLRRDWKEKSQAIEADLQGYVIHRTRSDIHQRITRRTRQMLERGAIQEVAQTELSPSLEKAIGVAQIRDYLKGTISLNECAEKINAATRQYAKRQETWFRRESWLTPISWGQEQEFPQLQDLFIS